MENSTQLPDSIKWYHYLAAFFAGFFLANVVPHFVHGISGDPFPTPFASPPGKGLSSPLVNSLWACFNLLVGCVLLRVSKTSPKNKGLLLALFIGILSVSIMLSIAFADKVKA
jgi:hypothetical protein